MTLAEAPPGTWGHQVCAAAGVAFFFSATACLQRAVQLAE